MIDAPDIAQHMNRVARELLGAPNERLSKDKELRYGTNGSLSIDLAKGTWFDHQNDEGGGVLDLIKREKGLTGFAAFELVQQIVGERSEHVPPSANGAAKPTRKVVATFDYRDAAGEPAFQVVRFAPKQFLQRRWDGNGWDYHGGPPLLYRLPQVLEAVAQERPVFIVEGEGKVDALARLNVPATCNAGGAKKWKPEHSHHLRGAEVIILPDNDQPGREHANVVGLALQGIAASVRVLELPGLKPKGDIINWIEGGGTAEQFWRLVEAKPSEASEAGSPRSTDDEASTPLARPPAFADDALALRFAGQHASKLRYVALWSRWMLWDGIAWKSDDTRLAFSLAREVCRKAASECNKAKLAVQLASAKTRAAVIVLANDDRRLAATSEQWDFETEVFNTKEKTSNDG